jgi:hypothetical protein
MFPDSNLKSTALILLVVLPYPAKYCALEASKSSTKLFVEYKVFYISGRTWIKRKKIPE